MAGKQGGCRGKRGAAGRKGELQPETGGCRGREGGQAGHSDEGRLAAKGEKLAPGAMVPQAGTGQGGVGGNVSERIPDREIQDHITDIGGAFKVPL